MAQRHLSRLVGALVACILALIPPAAFAIDYDDHVPGEHISWEDAINKADVQRTHYEQLGLTLDTDGLGDNLAAPLPTDRVTDIYVPHEVYVAANGNYANYYTVRDYLETLGPTDTGSIDKQTNVHDDYGQMLGAYGFYRLGTSWPNTVRGGGTASYLSANTNSVLARTKLNFSGKYATSDAMSLTAGGDSKQDVIAELRAFGTNSYTDLDSSHAAYGQTHFLGKLEIDVSRLNTKGERSHVITLYPTVNASQLLSSGYFKHPFCGYNQELDAYFEIECGDVDGDGIDEVFCYAGAYMDEDGTRYAIVDVFHSTDGKSFAHNTQKVAAGPADSYPSQFTLEAHPKQALRGTPVVTLATGDLDRDGSDELAVTVSAPTENTNVPAVGGLEVFMWENGALNSVTGLERISLAAGDSALGLVSANCTFGDFKVPGTTYSTTALIVAGYQSLSSSSTGTTTYNAMGYRFVYFDPATGSFKKSGYLQHALGKDGRLIAESASRKASKSGRWMPILAPLALGCAHLEVPGDFDSMDDHVLAGGDVYTFNLSSGFAATATGSMSLAGKHYNMLGLEHKNIDHIWIGDVVSGIVSNDKLYHESFLAVVGIHRDEPPGKNDDYYWMDVAHFTFGDGVATKIRTGQEGVICESNRVNTRYGTFVSLCLPNIDNDGIRMRYVDKAVVVSEPHALAIIQDPPYFANVDESHPYASNGVTSFGSGTEQSTTNGVHLSYALGIGFDAQFEVMGAVHFNSAVEWASSFDYQHTSTVSYSSGASAHIGSGPMVLAAMDPAIYYFYEVFDPDKQQWSGTVSMPIHCGQVTSMISVDQWNNVADQCTSIAHINSDILGSVTGDPTTYTNSLFKGAEEVYPASEYESTYKQVSSAAGAEHTDTYQSITLSKGNSTSFQSGLAASLAFLAGAGVVGNSVEAGMVVDADFCFTHATSSVDSTYFNAVVDGLPALTSLNAATPDHYGFRWKLVVNKLEQKKDKNPFGDTWLVGYDIPEGTVSPSENSAISMPTSPHIVEATDGSLTLEWDASNFGVVEGERYYEVYVQRSDGGTDPTLPRRFPASQGEQGNGKVRYIIDGLSANRAYSFRVCAVTGSETGGVFTYKRTSLPSTTFSGYTLSEGERCTVDPLTSYPSPAEVEVGDDLTLSCGGSWYRDEDNVTEDLSNRITYNWFQKSPTDRQWHPINGNVLGTSDEDSAQDPSLLPEAGPDFAYLTLKNLQAKDDGTLVKCVVGFNDFASDSNTIEIRVTGPGATGPIETVTTLAEPTPRVEASGEPTSGMYEPASQTYTTGDVPDDRNEEKEDEREQEENDGMPVIDDREAPNRRLHLQAPPSATPVTPRRISRVMDPVPEDASSQQTTSSTNSGASPSTSLTTSTTSGTMTPSPDSVTTTSDTAPVQNTTVAATQAPVQTQAPTATTATGTPTAAVAVAMPLANTADTNVSTVPVALLAAAGLITLVASRLRRQSHDEQG